MCEGFGIIVDHELNLYWTGPDTFGNCSHSLTLHRLGWQDNTDIFIRPFVRVQYKDWVSGSFKFDEPPTLPGWVEENCSEIQAKCDALLARVVPLWMECQHIIHQAWREYVSITRGTLSWESFWGIEAKARTTMRDSMSAIPGYVPEKKG